MSIGLLMKIAQVFGLLSVVSIGGINALLPEIRRQVVDAQGWMDNATFAHLFAISNAAPGPNVILVSLIGWHLAGLAGLIVATLAIITPPCLLAFLVARGLARWSGSPWALRLKAGLAPLALGLILASGISMMRIADHHWLTVTISVATAGFVVLSGRNPLWALGTGAVAAVAALHAGLIG